MAEALRYLGQAGFYLLTAAALGYFAAAPSYTHFPPDQALIKLSFAHGGERKGECRRRSAEEIAKLPPNMRRPLDCPRERVPLYVELELDGTPRYRAVLPPTGLSGDGPSRVYERFAVAPGPHAILARLRDSGRSEGFDYIGETHVDLAAGRNFVIDFRTEAGGFIFK